MKTIHSKKSPDLIEIYIKLREYQYTLWNLCRSILAQPIFNVQILGYAQIQNRQHIFISNISSPSLPQPIQIASICWPSQSKTFLLAIAVIVSIIASKSSIKIITNYMTQQKLWTTIDSCKHIYQQLYQHNY